MKSALSKIVSYTAPALAGLGLIAMTGCVTSPNGEPSSSDMSYTGGALAQGNAAFNESLNPRQAAGLGLLGNLLYAVGGAQRQDENTQKIIDEVRNQENLRKSEQQLQSQPQQQEMSQPRPVAEVPNGAFVAFSPYRAFFACKKFWGSCEAGFYYPNGVTDPRESFSVNEQFTIVGDMAYQYSEMYMGVIRLSDMQTIMSGRHKDANGIKADILPHTLSPAKYKVEWNQIFNKQSIPLGEMYFTVTEEK